MQKKFKNAKKQKIQKRQKYKQKIQKRKKYKKNSNTPKIQ